MTEEQHRRFVIFVAAYFTLATAFILVLIFSTIYLLTKDDEPCVWEDCTMLRDLPLDDGARIVGPDGPVCLELGDPGCLVVPD